MSPQKPGIMYDAARVPSPKDGANVVAQPMVPGARAATGTDMASERGPTPAAVLQTKAEEAQQGGAEEEEEQKTEPVLVKKPHREILDHERKRRVELKCMELQEMMEEQGYVQPLSADACATFSKFGQSALVVIYE